MRRPARLPDSEELEFCSKFHSSRQAVAGIGKIRDLATSRPAPRWMADIVELGSFPKKPKSPSNTIRPAAQARLY